MALAMSVVPFMCFLAARAALYLHMGRTEWVTDWPFGPLWSDNLQLPYTSKSEVIWNRTTSNFLVYNLLLPHITPNFLMIATGHGHGGQDRTGQDRTGQDRQNCHLNLTFLFAFLREFRSFWDSLTTKNMLDLFHGLATSAHMVFYLTFTLWKAED